MAKKKPTKAAKTAAPKKPAAAAPPPPAAEPAKPKKGKQLKLPAEGMARATNPEIDALAEAYREKRDARMALTKEEKAAKQSLLDVAKKHGITVYVYESEDGDEYEVKYKAKTDEEIKVKRVKAEPDETDDED